MQVLPFVLTAAAGALAGATVVGFSSAGVRELLTSRRIAARRAAESNKLQHEAHISRLQCEVASASTVSTSAGWRVVEVTQISDESEDCRSFYLEDPSGEPLPPFVPGQFLMIRPALGGTDLPSRCYSLSDSPDRPWWRLSIKRQVAPPGTRTRGKPGLSAWLHEHVRVGDCLLVKGPSGHFVVDQDHTGPIVLLAAGIGITPMLSMLRWALEENRNRAAYLLFQAQDEDHWPFGRLIHGWQPHCGGLRTITYFSRQEDLPLDVPGEVCSGKFGAAEVLDRITDADQAKFYMCGPDSWMQMLREGFIASGIAADNVRWESFGGSNAAAKKSKSPAVETNKSQDSSSSPKLSCKVRFALSETEAQAGDAADTIWDIAKENGIELPSGCHSGACGSCKIRLLKGKVKYNVEPSMQVEEGECLACVAVPETDVEVQG